VSQRRGACRKCGLPIAFKRVGGKLWPMNRDGTGHFDVCRVEQFEKMKRDGVAFDDAESAGYRADERVMFTRLSSLEPVRGANYRETNCDCGTPPWEVCIHSDRS